MFILPFDVSLAAKSVGLLRFLKQFSSTIERQILRKYSALLKVQNSEHAYCLEHVVN
jgi:hypothetical protein